MNEFENQNTPVEEAAPVEETPVVDAAPVEEIHEIPTYDAEVTEAPAPEKKGLSITALILGIISLVLACAWYLAIPLGIAAVICGAIGSKKGGKGMAIGGIICGSLGILVGLVWAILAITVFAQVANEMKTYAALLF